ncbi:MAG: 3-deoxy-D-manno-octulosonic acid transferase [Bacteroidales bacterium]|nr:3-deoxy-D-manno-octulosonic acid transferase [Bacteroidales bacterium]
MTVISKIWYFVTGRIGQFRRLRRALEGVSDVVWVDCPSLGEFEEARPVIMRMRAIDPKLRFLVTFYSPSGYRNASGDPAADWVFRTPIDTLCNAKRFLDIVRPVKAIIAVDEYWLNLLHELRRRNIDTYLISARFVPGMRYFKKPGFLYRDMFRRCFSRIYLKDAKSLKLLEGIGVANAEVAGDPRMDRMKALVDEDWRDEVVEKWLRGGKAFIAGSTHREDDPLVAALAEVCPEGKFIIVPHEVDDCRISRLRSGLRCSSALYSSFGEGDEEARVLIVDTVGKLSRIYRYGFAAYVGGAIGGNPHNVIEPASYGCPVTFGPNIGKYCHCGNLVDCGAGRVVRTPAELLSWYRELAGSAEALRKASEAAVTYCAGGLGAAARIADGILKG